MGGYLERALNVRRGECTPASPIFLYLFLIIACYAKGRVVGSAMFLSVYPTYLPHAIVATAAVVGVFASIYIRLLHRVRLETLIVASLLFFASSFALFWWASRFDGRTVYPLVYIWVYMAGAMRPTMG